MKKISIVGLGYTGLSNALILSKNHQVFAVETDLDKVEKINNNHSPIEDLEFEEYIQNNKLHLSAILKSNCIKNLIDSDYVLMSIPTECSAEKSDLSVSLIEDDIKSLSENEYHGTIVINTNVPIGFTDEMLKRYPNLKIIYSPDLSRDSKNLNSLLNPERIVIGSNTEHNLKAEEFLHVLNESMKSRPSLHLVTTREAEAVKLFAYYE